MTTKQQIDELLAQNASIWANLGTGSKLDLGTKEAADAKWLEILAKIKDLDEATWKLLARTDDTSPAIPEVDDWGDAPSFIDEDRLAAAEENIKDIPPCSLDDEECLSCGA